MWSVAATHLCGGHIMCAWEMRKSVFRVERASGWSWWSENNAQQRENIPYRSSLAGNEGRGMRARHSTSRRQADRNL
jgi:hypothetical protein